MNRKLVYDLPTRIFHWTFAGLFVAAFFIAKTYDDENPVFVYHMFAGLMLGGLVILRLLWGLVGTKYARFSSFSLHPKDLISYLQGILSGDKKRWNGHNPASSWATLVMLASALMLAITGFLMTSGYKETFEDLHELMANAFLVTVLLHIAGVLLHSFRHQDGIALSMIHGKKEGIEGPSENSPSRPLVAVFLMIILLGMGSYLVKNYNQASGQLNFFGKTLTLGENEKEDENEAKKEENGKSDSHDDDEEEDD